MNAPGPAARLSQLLAQNAEAVCRHYLSSGRRQGRYWLVGDADNAPGRSLYVRLKGPDSGKGAAGKWTDAATGEHGDLLDLIARNRRLGRLRDVLDEASAFLSQPQPEPSWGMSNRASAPQGSTASARRLFAMSRPIAGTLVEMYLRHRGIAIAHDAGALRFHPRCYYRADEQAPTGTWPAMIARVSDLDGHLTGVHRTWLDPNGHGKAPVETPRRALGALLGNAVRFGGASEILAAGEGIETMLSLRCALPQMPMVAALSANHLAALVLPATLRWLYIACDADVAGDAAATALTARAQAAEIAAIVLSPRLGDFNEDLRAFGLDALCRHLRSQLLPAHAARYLDPAKTR